MLTCKKCEWYERYNGDRMVDGEIAVMFCPKLKVRVPRNEGYAAGINTCSYGDFTPKKPAEKVEKSCQTCCFSMLNNGIGKPCMKPVDKTDGGCKDYSGWQPIPKKTCGNCKKARPSEDSRFPSSVRCSDSVRRGHYPKDNPRDDAVCWLPIPKVEKSCDTCCFRFKVSPFEHPCVNCRDTPGASCNQRYWKPQKPKTPNRKGESKMWKKLRKRGRRITMAWDLFGVFLLCRWVNPWVCEFWRWAILSEDTWERCPLPIVIPWAFTALSITAILAALYALDRLAAWWYGEDK